MNYNQELVVTLSRVCVYLPLPPLMTAMEVFTMDICTAQREEISRFCPRILACCYVTYVESLFVMQKTCLLILSLTYPPLLVVAFPLLI